MEDYVCRTSFSYKVFFSFRPIKDEFHLRFKLLQSSCNKSMGKFKQKSRHNFQRLLYKIILCVRYFESNLSILHGKFKRFYSNYQTETNLLLSNHWELGHDFCFVLPCDLLWNCWQSLNLGWHWPQVETVQNIFYLECVYGKRPCIMTTLRKKEKWPLDRWPLNTG